MSGYRSGLTGVLLDYSVKKYKGHRAIPTNIRNVLGEMAVDPHRSKMPLAVMHTLVRENEVRVVNN